MKKFNKILILLSFIFIAIILVLSIRGVKGNITEKDLDQIKWIENGPLELSPDRGRFALTMSIVENKTFYFSIPIAKFTTPDLGYKNGHYVSLFAPGVSFLIIPGYLIGKLFGISQVGAYAVISFFALLNSILIYKIAVKLGSRPVGAILGAFVFIFATPAFSYGVSLYQHNISTFIILLSIYILLIYKKVWSLLAIWILCGISVVIDYPNFFMMLPIGVVALSRIIIIKNKPLSRKVFIKMYGFLTFITILIPFMFLFWFNNASYGNPLQMSGTVASIGKIDNKGKPVFPDKLTKKDTATINPADQKRSAVAFFNPRNMLNGFYILILSSERGILCYTPVMFFAVIGMIILYKKNQFISILLLSIILFNICIYSMWGDPWGGWAFGARYLVPTYAVCAILISIMLTNLKGKKLIMPIFVIILTYSVAVNLLGAMTTNRIPPKGEAEYLSRITNRDEKYSYDRDIDYLNNNFTKSFIWNTYLYQYIKASDYYLIILISILIPSVAMTVFLTVFDRRKAYAKNK